MTDSVLVRAPAGVVYRTLTDLDGWPSWLVGCRSRRLAVPSDVTSSDGAPSGPVDRTALVLPRRRRGLGPRSWRLEVTAYGWRHDLGVCWTVDGAVKLDAEWWLEVRDEGTVLHHVVHEVRSRAERALQHRQVMMGTMQAMKDHLELAVALASGRIP